MTNQGTAVIDRLVGVGVVVIILGALGFCIFLPTDLISEENFFKSERYADQLVKVQVDKAIH